MRFWAGLYLLSGVGNRYSGVRKPYYDLCDINHDMRRMPQNCLIYKVFWGVLSAVRWFHLAVIMDTIVTDMRVCHNDDSCQFGMFYSLLSNQNPGRKE